MSIIHRVHSAIMQQGSGESAPYHGTPYGLCSAIAMILLAPCSVRSNQVLTSRPPAQSCSLNEWYTGHVC